MSTLAPTTEQTRAAWDGLAAAFDRHLTPRSLDEGAAIIERLGLTPGSRVLDVACGSGALAIPAARRGADVVAVDIAPRMIAALAERARAEGLNIDGRVMDAHALDLPDDTFDASVSLNGVTMSPRLSVELSEMTRVTKPGGTVLVAAFGPLPTVGFLRTFVAGVKAVVPDFTGPPMDPPPPPFQIGEPAAMTAALETAGLAEVAVETVEWEMPFESGDELWETVLSSNPLGAMMVAGFTDGQAAWVRDVLDGLLREQSDGTPGATLNAAVNLGSGQAA